MCVKYGWVQGKTQCLICRLNEDACTSILLPWLNSRCGECYRVCGVLGV